MYNKIIKFQKLVMGTWIDQTLRTTDDAIWHHITKMQLKHDIRSIVVVDYIGA